MASTKRDLMTGIPTATHRYRYFMMRTQSAV